MVPKGAEVIQNEVGVAPMFNLRIRKARCFFVPGVPREFKHLVETTVLPRIEAVPISLGEGLDSDFHASHSPRAETSPRQRQARPDQDRAAERDQPRNRLPGDPAHFACMRKTQE